MMDSAGVGKDDAGWAIAKLIGGAALAGAGAFFAPATGGATLAAMP
jgi:hypothetical protein